MNAYVFAYYVFANLHDRTSRFQQYFNIIFDYFNKSFEKYQVNIILGQQKLKVKWLKKIKLKARK